MIFANGILVIGIATTNVRISNGTLHGFPYGVPFSPSGIELLGGGGCHVSNMTIIRFLSGINLGDYGGDSINNNVCSSNAAGISLQSSSNSIRGNVCSNNGAGIEVLPSQSNNSITGNVCSSNLADGIVVLTGAHSNSIKGNTALGNGAGYFAVDLEDYNPNCDSNTWVGNTFVTSEAYGVHQASCIR